MKINNQIKAILLAIGMILLLGACRRDPMIQLSEENQAAIESKEAEAKKNRFGRKKEENHESDEEVVKEPHFAANTAFKREDLEKAEDLVIYSLDEFNFFKPYELREYQSGDQFCITYLDYEGGGQYQLRQIANHATEVCNFQLAAAQWIEWCTEEFSQSLTNRWNILYYDQTVRPNIKLQLPLTVGSQWEVEADLIAEITAYYRELPLDHERYQEVLEVTTYYPDYDHIEYYTRDHGLIAYWIKGVEANETDIFWQLNSVEDNVLIDLEIPLYQPRDAEEGALLEEGQAEIPWKTNPNVSEIFTHLFQDLGWLSTNVQINSIQEGPEQITVDFSQGVVADFNSHPQKENGVLPAVVMTLARNFGVDKVYLTVNGNGLSPDYLAYPEGGVWVVDEAWVNGTSRPPLKEEIPAVAESSSDSANNESAAEEEVSSSLAQ